MYRDLDNGIIFGVCAGLADQTGIPVLAIRLLWAFLGLHFGLGIIVYLIVALCLPIKK